MDFLNSTSQLKLKEIFEQIGTLSSILSFVITIFVWMSVKKIKDFYLFTARFPDLTTRLSELASGLSDGLNAYEGITTKIKKILIDIEVILKSLRKKSNGDVKKSINLLIKEIQKVSSNAENIPKEMLENIHISTYKVIKQCEDLYEESRWER